MSAVDGYCDAVGTECLEILSHVVDSQVCGVGIEAEEADIEIVVIVKKSHLRRLGRRLSGGWPSLNKSRRRNSKLPGSLFKVTVNVDLLGYANSRRYFFASNVFILRLGRCILREAGQGRQRRHEAQYKSGPLSCHARGCYQAGFTETIANQGLEDC